jgi:putative tryptophan/tyrosine transport system substrate-binding protein
MRRRDFIAGIGAAAWPLAGRAQRAAPPVIGFLNLRSPAEAGYVLEPFLQGLRDAGYVDGQNVAIEYRWAEYRFDRLSALAADLVSRHVNVIITSGAALEVKAVTSTIPIVFTTGSDPVATGLVERLDRPGANVTGASFYSGALVAKQLELLHELVPRAAVIGMLRRRSTGTGVKDAQTAASTLGQHIHELTVENDGEFERAFATLVQQKAGALVVDVNPFFDSRRERLIELASRHAIPTVYYDREFVTAGGLICYGASIMDAYRQAGVYAGRILKGEKPGDLPVMLPTKFDMALNLKTAKALSLEVPTSILLRATEVIE